MPSDAGFGVWDSRDAAYLMGDLNGDPEMLVDDDFAPPARGI